MRKLIDLNEGDLLVRGLYPSLAENQKEVWRTGNNIEFRGKRVRKATGFSNEYTTESKVRAIAQAYVEGVRRAYWAETESIWAYDIGSAAPLRIGNSFSGGAGRWNLETWGTWLLATNQEDDPKVWKNINTPDSMVDLGGLTGIRADRKYRLFKKHKNHMLGYFGQRAEWSSESDVELWVPDTTNSAGGVDIRDLDSDIIAVVQLGPDMALYSIDTMVLQRYVGEPFYFGFEPAINGIGSVGENAVVHVANKNYGMSPKSFFVTDGISSDVISHPMINTLVFGEKGSPGQFDPEQGRAVVGLHDEENEMVCWWYPGIEGAIYGVGFNYKNGDWTILDQPVTAAGEKQVFDSPLIGTDNTIGFRLGNNLGALPMVSEIETFAGDAGDRETYKQWDLYRADFSGTGLEVRFGFGSEPEEVDEWTPWAALAKENWIHRESLYITVGLRSTAIDVDWRLNGFSVHGVLTGAR